VEADHFDSALLGANAALMYYAGKEDRARAKEWVLEGFRAFASVQAGFMKSLGSGR